MTKIKQANKKIPFSKLNPVRCSLSNRVNIGLVVLALGVLIGAVFFIYSWAQRNPRVLDVEEIVEMQAPEWYLEPLVVSRGEKVLSITPLAGEKVQVERLPVQTGIDDHFIYRDVYPYTDVIHTEYDYKIKEEMVFKQTGHPDKFVYRINLDQYEFSKDSQGNLIFYAKGKKGSDLHKIFTIPAAFMTDAQGRQSSEVEISLTQEGVLTIIPSKSWLAQATYPVILDPTIEIHILNLHSHPQKGEYWTVEFTTQGRADLKIIPDDQATIDDDEFVGLWCGEKERAPQILENDVIYFTDWECNEIAKVVHYTLKAGKHTLKFDFGGQVAYAYNNSTTAVYKTATTDTPFTVPAGVTTVTVKSWGAGAGSAAGGNNANGGAGGGGGYVEDNITVLGGDTITVIVGGGGGGGTNAFDNKDDGAGGGGGGFSGVKLNGSYVVIAGGGGGGGSGSSAGEVGGAGGGGGGSSGSNGTRGANAACGAGIGDNGDGGTSGAGGAGGADCGNGLDGVTGTGGNPGGNGGDGGDGDGGSGGGSGGASDGTYTGGIGGDWSTGVTPGAGGGGAGYYGGGGGEGGASEGAGGAGGGSGWCSGACTANTASVGTAPANSGDSDFTNCDTANQATGGALVGGDTIGNNGGPGCVLLIYNRPPTITVETTESSDPAEVDDIITFSATANDPDDDSWYLAVCTTNAVTPGASGVAPDCTVGTFCVSGSAVASDSPNTCDWTATEGVLDWYAFACDNSTTFTACTSTPDTTNSPITITAADVYAPTITSVSAPSVKPGSQVSFTVDWDDPGDSIKVKICKTNSLTGQNCTDGYWASSTAFTTADPVTLSTTTVGIAEGHHDFWAFVCDDGGACSLSYHSFFRIGYTTYIDPNSSGKTYIDPNASGKIYIITQ